METRMEILEIENFSKTYKGGKTAVKNLSLQVKAGDIYGFIGHNGAGKSTTIKAIVGVMDFEAGDIWIDGHSVKDEPIACKKMTAYIPDNPDLYEFMTGIQYLNFVADIFGIDTKIREERIQKYGDLFEITSSYGDLISSYSHGMKQKLVAGTWYVRLKETDTQKAGASTSVVVTASPNPPTLYQVTVNSGDGDGTYAEGATVTITADAASSGKVFDKWVVASGTVTLGSITTETTTFTMPAGAVEVTATYKDVPADPTPTPDPTVTITAADSTDATPTKDEVPKTGDNTPILSLSTKVCKFFISPCF